VIGIREFFRKFTPRKDGQRLQGNRILIDIWAEGRSGPGQGDEFPCGPVWAMVIIAFTGGFG
jgi:hypothetical protein